MASQTKVFYSVLAYIWILWLVGLVSGGNDPVIKRHVNQGLNLFILWTAASILALFPILDILGGILYILSLVLMIMGILSAVKQDDRPLPILSIVTLIR